jgi:hypothetical protein
MIQWKRNICNTNNSCNTSWSNCVRNSKLGLELFRTLEPKNQNCICTLDKGNGDETFKLLLELQKETPSIHPDPGQLDQGILIFSASSLKPEHPELIAQRLNTLLAKKVSGPSKTQAGNHAGIAVAQPEIP